MATFCEAEARMEPMSQMMQPTKMARFLPSMSAIVPEMSAPRSDPPGMAAEMPPWSEEETLREPPSVMSPNFSLKTGQERRGEGSVSVGFA